jgi:iron complex outermembrane receptor protein
MDQMNKRRTVSPWVLALAAGLSSVGFGVANAQSAPDTADTVDEIVVTAQKRVETARTVPQSLTVLSGENLGKQGVQSLEDLAAQVPGFATTSFGGAGQVQMTIRGITTGLNVSPTVSTYLDDVPLGSGTAYSTSATLSSEFGSFDVQRVEVLRGPQGTLYGASAFGGVVKYVLTQPQLGHFGGKLELEGSGTEGGGFNYGLRAALNLSPGERFALRADVIQNHDDGFVDNLARNDENANRNDSTTLRLALLAKPTENLTLRASYISQDLDRNGSSDVYYDLATRKPAFGDLNQVQPTRAPFNQTYQLYSTAADYDFGFAILSGIYSHQNIDNDYGQDVSEYYPVLLGAFLTTDAANVDNKHATEKDTAELRLVSASGGRLEWLAGLYATHEDLRLYQQLQGFLGGVQVPIDIGTFDITAEYKEVAAYANATWKFTPSLDATLGIRYSHDSQNFSQFGSGLLGQSNPGGSSENSVATYLATVRWRLNDSSMLYARIASGYRPGGPNLIGVDPISGDPIGDPTFEPDTLWNYEVGAKLRPLPWLSLEAAIYRIDWDNIQLAAVRNGLGVYANAKGAQSTGAELSATVAAQGWTVNGALSLIDAKLTDDTPDVGGVAGERLPNVAKVSWALSADRRFALSGDWSASAGASLRYTGERTASYSGSLTFPQYRLPDYTALDLRAGVTNGRWSLNAYLRNVTDERGQLSSSTIFSALGTPARVSLLRPRTFGLILSAEF